MGARSLLAILMAFVSFFPVLSACLPTPQVQILEHSITVNEFTADIGQSTAVVRGVVRNQYVWPVQNCVVTVDFFDYQGGKIGTYSDTLSRMEPGQAWNFKVELKGAEAWKAAWYRISIANK